jgi:hypothetical protein
VIVFCSYLEPAHITLIISMLEIKNLLSISNILFHSRYEKI